MNAPYALPAELTIYTVGDLHASLIRDLPAADSALLLDASQVTDIDSAGLQLLLALAQACEHRGQAISLVAPSSALIQASTALGVQDLLTPNQGAAS